MQDRTITHPNIPKVKNMEVGTAGKNPLYFFSVFDTKLKNWTQANVYYNERDEEHDFTASTISGTNLGRIKVVQFNKLIDGSFGCPALIIQSDSISKYGHETDLMPKIEIKDLENKQRETYKYVGYNLMKIAMQEFKHYKCKVDLSAGWSSHTFYWKLGFRPNDAKECERIAQQVIEGVAKKDLGAVKMHLPRWASEAWLKEIENNPIQKFV